MKIFASDYDGTIKVNDKVSQRNVDALNMWSKKGNKFGIVTGRSVESIISENETYQFNLDFLICNNGGVIYDHNMKLLKAFEIHYESAISLIDDIRKMDCNCFVLNNGFHRAKEVVNNSYEDYKYGNYSSGYSVEKIVDERKICQIVISINDNKVAKEIEQFINEKYKGYVEAYTNINCVDVVPTNVSKASGMDFISDYYGFNFNDIYTMGDSYNDLPMIEKFNSATLAHAFTDIKDKIDVIVEDVAEYLYSLEK